MKLLKTLFLLILFSQYFNAQSQSLDWNFTQHLIQNENYTELQFLLNENKSPTDTITFLKGWCYLMKKKKQTKHSMNGIIAIQLLLLELDVSFIQHF